MNKQELIDKLKKQLTAPSEIDDTDFNKFYDLAINYAIYLAEQLDEPKRPVVPRYVADFYESIKDDLEDGVYEICIQLYNCDLDGRINFWFGCNDNKPIETLVKMKLYGYEVEKEKLYTVELPNPNRTDVSLALGLYNDGKVAIFAVFTDSWKYEKRYKLTEAEIKENFDWAWQFAKEVEE